MEKSLILARTLSDGKLWRAAHFDGSPNWTWFRASESANDILGHLVLTIPHGTPIPAGPGDITAAMLPGHAGEGVTRP